MRSRSGFSATARRLARLAALPALLALGCEEPELPTAPPAAPALVVTPAALAVSQVSVRVHHTCALTTAGAAYCWGGNDAGQLGDGTVGNSRTRPTRVAGALAFRQVGAGAGHSCGVTTGSVGYCWGGNSEGQLGDGTRTDRTRPVAVASPGP